MRVFVTRASGLATSAVPVERRVAARQEVGLTRSERSWTSNTALIGQVQCASLDDLELLSRGDATNMFRAVGEYGSEADHMRAVAVDRSRSKELGEANGLHLQGSVLDQSIKAARLRVGMCKLSAGVDVPASGAKAQALLTWKPQIYELPDGFAQCQEC